MTVYHLIAIIAALTLPAVCMLSRSCGDNLPQIIGLSLTVIGGVFGHATGADRRKKHTHKEGAASAGKQ